MDFEETTSGDVSVNGGEDPPCAGFASGAVPEAKMPIKAVGSNTGVSTHSVLASNNKRRSTHVAHWYVLRTTYGREKRAADYLSGKGVKVFCPTVIVDKYVGGKRKSVDETLIPNIFFAFGTEDELKLFVYDNINLPYLRFYYQYFHDRNNRLVKNPLTVTDSEMESLRLICAMKNEDIIVEPGVVEKFKSGQTVRVTNGIFKGVIGRVARYHGQQRVAVQLEGLLTVCTAYIPNPFLEKI